MIKVERFINELMSSNCYIVWDDVIKRAIIIDPASEYSLREIDFIEENGLNLDYIILTHEHTDHTWGVNALLDKYKTKVICSEICRNNLPKSGNMYFRFYYEREDYTYSVGKVDITTDSINNQLPWGNIIIKFIPTPGHSLGSICIDISGNLFTGDTIMQYKPYINKRSGNVELYKQSILRIMNSYYPHTNIYPGHGVPFILKNYSNIL